MNRCIQLMGAFGPPWEGKVRGTFTSGLGFVHVFRSLPEFGCRGPSPVRR